MSAPKPEAAEPQSFARRDFIAGIEKEVQVQWSDCKIYEVDAGTDNNDGKDKYFATFPYPYMNGVLHLGHAFTFAKVEFQARYQRNKGKKVLFPFGFHCTGMPIAACADKLKREVAEYGLPPQFPVAEDKSSAAEETAEETAADASKPEEKKIKTKAKLAKKASSHVYQWEIMKEMGVKEEDVEKFRDAYFWLKYFPPIGMNHLKQFGVCVDFRRSFITTDINPYYDAFVRWQFNTLKQLDKIAFGSRPTIFSPLDDQPCADHDRAVGEGVKVVDYTLIKIELLQPYPEKLSELLSAYPQYASKQIYLPAATLRPETMYGQTNCWLLPDGEYGVYNMNGNDIYVCSERSAQNMSYQDMMPVRGKPELLGKILGQEFMGFPVKSPLAIYEKVYVLPLLTIKMDKGTGVVTSVPSDAPDDYAAWMDLCNKDKLRSKYNITESQVVDFPPVEIIETPGLGRTPAKDLCIAEKVQSQNDREKLERIKDTCYTEGFYKGIMLVGQHAGKKVSDAKAIIKGELIAAGLAAAYSEPEGRVISRSGCECVVALCDQWYLKYGESQWQQTVKQHIEQTLECYNPASKNKFIESIEWLREWACSRSYGLGTHMPWDTKYVIESLSDSTIYMAYYTVAHILQGNLEGTIVGSGNIQAEDMTDDVWNYVLLRKLYPEPPTNSKIPLEILQKMRQEFEFWYPMNMRASGKDLIPNHLTMSLYNHAAIWDNQPQYWPQSFFTNGHLQLNSEKMSKSTGNFLTLHQAIQKYTADCTRFALADSGDGLDDANFVEKVADTAIVRLFKETKWVEDMIDTQDMMRHGIENMNFFDHVFMNEINELIVLADQSYATMQYREALKNSFYDLVNVRDNYRANINVPLHWDCIKRYIEVFTVLLSPICPHITQYLYRKIGNAGFVVDAPFPEASPVDLVLKRKTNYLREVQKNLRDTLAEKKKELQKKKAKGGAVENDPNSVTLYVADSYPDWQAKVLDTLSRMYSEAAQKGQADLDMREMAAQLKNVFADKKLHALAMAFAGQVREDMKIRGTSALEQKTPFDELELLQQHFDYITRDLEVQSTEIKPWPQDPALQPSKAGKTTAVPGRPYAVFFFNAPQ